jgi:hypothetical protein
MGVEFKDLPKHVQEQIEKQSLPEKSKGYLARAASPTGRSMNKWEQAYAAHLEKRKLAGEILMYQYEAIKFRLADHNTFYTPDFIVQNSDHHLEVHEVKGHWEDDARVKIKVAKSQFPYMIFYAITKNNGVWSYERIR